MAEWWEEDEEVEAEPALVVRDSNGNILSDGDSVTLIKDLKVKGSSITLKRGTVIKNIRLTDDAQEIECRTDKVKGLVLRAEFMKKA
jgi:protein PhnA